METQIAKSYSSYEFGNKFLVSLKNHTELVDTLKNFCTDKGIRAGVISGIGAVSSATIRFFNPSTKKYEDMRFDEQMEIANLTGNVTTLNGEVYIHLHITLGRSDASALSGHLLSATLNGAGEFFVEKLDGEVPRRYDEEIGLNIF